MGSEKKKGTNDHDHGHELQSYTPPKLSILTSRPSMPQDLPTPPPRTTVSVPFQWEEAPGKPRPYPTESAPKSSANVRRTLELPPRLLFSEAKVSNMPSPTTVLDGPYVGRAVSFTTSYRSPRLVGGKDLWNGNFRSSRWSRPRKDHKDDAEGSFDFSTCAEEGPCGDDSTTVKITRVRRRGSFVSLSQARSHFWASVYESVKQVVPWKRKLEKQGKWAPKVDTV